MKRDGKRSRNQTLGSLNNTRFIAELNAITRPKRNRSVVYDRKMFYDYQAVLENPHRTEKQKLLFSPGMDRFETFQFNIPYLYVLFFTSLHFTHQLLKKSWCTFRTCREFIITEPAQKL